MSFDGNAPGDVETGHHRSLQTDVSYGNLRSESGEVVQGFSCGTC